MPSTGYAYRATRVLCDARAPPTELSWYKRSVWSRCATTGTDLEKMEKELTKAKEAGEQCLLFCTAIAIGLCLSYAVSGTGIVDACYWPRREL
eukprot:946911-Rhodomonas_salina.12